MKFALPTLMTLVVLLSGCDETARLGAGLSPDEATGSTASASRLDAGALQRARPADIDAGKYTMIVPVEGPDFPHALFKSPVHAQEAGYCLSSDYGSVTKVIQGSDPRTRQSFYFIECEREDPSAAGLEARIAALEAQQPAWDARTAEMRAEAEAAAAAAAGKADDPYANCPVGEGGYPIVRDDCASR